MTLKTHVTAMATAAAVASQALPAAAVACTSARPGATVASLPEPWRGAIETLLQASATEGKVWSCTGGVIDLTLRDGGATLTVVSADGRSVSREVDAPDDVAPLGEALLAQPAPMAQPVPTGARPDATAAQGPKDSASAVKLPSAAEELPAPRVLVSALFAPRYAGGSNLVWGGATAGVAVPFGPWLAGAWIRYDGPSASLEKHGGGPINELCVGAAVGRSFKLAPLELRATALASAAVVTRSNGPMEPDETHLDGRFGAEARGVIPITSLLRAVVALDAEIAPARLGGEPHSGSMDSMDKERRTAFPAYTLGLGVGVEIAPR